MNPLEPLIGKKIAQIYRWDRFEDYEYYSPLDILIMIDNEEGLYLKRGAEEVSFEKYVDILDDLDEEHIRDHFGRIKDGDELKNLIGESITSIKIAEFKRNSLKGGNFEILKAKNAGCIIETENHRLVFYHDNGTCFLSIDLDIEIPNKSNWTLV
jgi:hypothetical protein